MKPAKSILPPDDIDAPDLVCIRVNAGWRDVLMTAMQRYEYPVSWEEGTDINRAEQQVFKWYQILRNAEEDCCDDVCLDFEPSESFIEYFPQNPFTEPDLTPDGYNGPPFYVEDGVVFTDLLRVSANPFDWPAIISAGMPRIRVNVSGAVKVGLGLVSIFAGGIIFITKDDDITTSKWYSLTSIGLIDVVAITAAIPDLIEALFSGDPTPEAIYQDQVIEVFFDTPGDHHIDITFLPRVSPETIIGFGGGLRKVEICGQQRETMDFRQNPDNPCQLQYRKKSSDEWSLMFDYGECMTNNCCEDTPPIYRFTIDGILERSTDDGATYEPAPQYDPRRNSPQFPPLAGDDNATKRCLAAAGAAALIKQQVGNELTDDMGRYTLAELISDWVNTVVNDGGNILEALITLAANQTFAIGIATLRAALTDTVYDTLQCILYCNISNDASFTESRWQAVKSDIADQIGGIASLFLQHLVNVLGAVGLTNLARSGGATEGDCDECTDCSNEPPVYIWDEIAAEPTRIFPDEDGIYTANSGTSLAPSGYYACSIYFHPGLPIPDHWKCYEITLLSTPPAITGTFVYRCEDYASDLLAHCQAQMTLVSNATPFTVQFTVGDICGEQ